MKMEASAGTLVNSPKLSPCSAAAGQRKWPSGSGPRDARPQTRPNLPPAMALPPNAVRTRRLLARPWLERIPYLSCFGFT